MVDVGKIHPLAILLLIISTHVLTYFTKSPIFILLSVILGFWLGYAGSIWLGYAGMRASSSSDVSEGENNNDDAQQNGQDGDQNDSNNGNLPLDRIELQSCSNSTVEICSLGTAMSSRRSHLALLVWALLCCWLLGG
mmetsp:Transcript_724/g.1154  ORF Transcript_724/g.1154 Transcript_724/m.1154 type:complete len:137 (-) Transcript_724:426-836(-)